VEAKTEQKLNAIAKANAAVVVIAAVVIVYY
jgi:hypothetical protein